MQMLRRPRSTVFLSDRTNEAYSAWLDPLKEGAEITVNDKNVEKLTFDRIYKADETAADERQLQTRRLQMRQLQTRQRLKTALLTMQRQKRKQQKILRQRNKGEKEDTLSLFDRSSGSGRSVDWLHENQ